MKTLPMTLTIAGSDSGGGAGIQADLKTFSALQTYGMSAITALTAQNTTGVQGIFPIPPEFIGQQLDSIFMDLPPDAVKIGMLHSRAVVKIVADKLKEYDATNVIVDPVMVAKSGDKLLEDDAIEALNEQILPLASVITPNLGEACEMLDQKITEEEQMEEAVRSLTQYGSKFVLLKGGHLNTESSNDVLYDHEHDSVYHLEAPRIKTENTHGTGCALSSAIAAYIARGFVIKDAVRHSKNFINGALQAGSDIKYGQGQGPVHHFFQWWNE